MTFPDDEFEEQHPVVYLQDERVFGTVISYGAYVSRVRYMKNGIAYEVVVENEDILNGE